MWLSNLLARITITKKTAIIITVVCMVCVVLAVCAMIFVPGIVANMKK